MNMKTKTLEMGLTQKEVNDLAGELFSAGFKEGMKKSRPDLSELTTEDMIEQYPNLMKFRKLLQRYKKISDPIEF